jgi:hypothetical protein
MRVRAFELKGREVQPVDGGEHGQDPKGAFQQHLAGKKLRIACGQVLIERPDREDAKVCVDLAPPKGFRVGGALLPAANHVLAMKGHSLEQACRDFCGDPIDVARGDAIKALLDGPDQLGPGLELNALQPVPRRESFFGI